MEVGWPCDQVSRYAGQANTRYAELIGSAQVKVLSRVRDLSGRRQGPMDNGATWTVRRAQGSAPQRSSSQNVSEESREGRGVITAVGADGHVIEAGAARPHLI